MPGERDSFPGWLGTDYTQPPPKKPVSYGFQFGEHGAWDVNEMLRRVTKCPLTSTLCAFLPPCCQSLDLSHVIQLSEWKPRAYLYKNFLSEAECNHIITKARPHLER